MAQHNPNRKETHDKNRGAELRARLELLPKNFDAALSYALLLADLRLCNPNPFHPNPASRDD